MTDGGDAPEPPDESTEDADGTDADESTDVENAVAQNTNGTNNHSDNDSNTDNDSSTDNATDTDTTFDASEAGPGRLRAVLLAAASGVAICAALPPWGWWPAAIAGIAGWVLLLERSPCARRRALVGYVVGVGWFGPSTLWMLEFSAPGWFAVVLLWFAPLAALASALAPPDARARLALPAALVGATWLAAHAPFGGAPLSTLAMTQAAGPLLPAARLGGDLLLSGLVGVAGATAAAAASRSARGAGIGAAIVAAAAVGGMLAPSGNATGEIRVALVQGGGEQTTRAEDTDEQDVLDRHVAASRTIDGPVDLILWPENVVDVDGLLADSAVDRALGELARELDATLVVGVTEIIDDERFTNSAVAYDPQGELVDRYDKVRRVPFGEYVPLRPLFEPLAAGVLPSRDQIPGTDPAVLDTPVGRLGVVVSWEVFFSRRGREAAQAGGEVMTNPTNGSSYWLTIVQSQQVASSRLRAVETGRWVLQAAPTGFSAVVTPSGEVRQRTAVSEQAVLVDRVELRDGWTPATQFGDLPALAAALGGAAALALAWWKARATIRSPRAASG